MRTKEKARRKSEEEVFMEGTGSWQSIEKHNYICMSADVFARDREKIRVSRKKRETGNDSETDKESEEKMIVEGREKERES